jgi:hypothetical protein
MRHSARIDPRQIKPGRTGRFSPSVSAGPAGLGANWLLASGLPWLLTSMQISTEIEGPASFRSSALKMLPLLLLGCANGTVH